jgi:caffeoyl-CoA O-methyltransferase
MLTLVPEEIEKYALTHTSPEADLLKELETETRAKMEMWRMQVGRIEGTFLKMLVKLTGAKSVVEVGMFTGYSALMMAEGLPDDGALITCDVDHTVEEVARRYFARSPHGKKIQIRMGPALDTLKSLKGPIDMAFIDADKENYSNYYEEFLRLLRPGGLIVADNTLWSGRVLNPTEASDRAIVAFNDRVQKDPRVENALLSVRDGMMLVRKL